MTGETHPLNATPAAGRRVHHCPICGDPGPKPRFVAREMVHGTREPFDYLRCGGCGTLYLADPPADIGPYYKNYYSTDRMVASTPPARGPGGWVKQELRKKLARLAMRHFSPRSGILERHTRPARQPGFRHLRRGLEARALRIGLGRLAHSLEFRSLWRAGLNPRSAILDVGCGNGFLVEALDHLGFTHVRGCDPYLQAETTFKGGARLVRRDLAEMEGGWDLIMLHHCFEHVPAPAVTAAQIGARLVSGGVCLLRFPNVDSIEFTRHGGNWWGIHAPRHFQLLSRKGIETVFAGTGLRLEQAWCDSVPEHYFYSQEYSRDIADHDPESVRQRGYPERNWPVEELQRIEQEVDELNDRMMGDWIVYLLRKS